jgi:Lar family restriction alleviation protein
MSEELKPCPFCGSNDIIQEFCNTPWRYIGCNQCEEEGPPADSHGEAVRLWNKRHITLPQAKQVLAEAGMVALPVEPNEAMTCAGLDCGPSADYDEVYEAMVAASQDKPDA